MKLATFTLAAILAASTASAGCLSAIQVDGVSLTLDRGAGPIEYLYDDLDDAVVSADNSHALRAEVLRRDLQAYMDNRIPRLEGHVAEDPDRFENPDRADIYWSDAEGNPVKSPIDATHVTSRCVLITVFWDGFDYVLIQDSVP